MWISVVTMFVGSVIVAEVGRRAAAGTLPRNHVAGIRLSSTMDDDESWRIAHLAGGPWMFGAGVIAALMSIGAGVAGIAFGDGAAAAAVLAAAGVLLVGVLLSARIGVSALRRRD